MILGDDPFPELPTEAPADRRRRGHSPGTAEWGPPVVDLTDPDVREALHVDERSSTGRSAPTRPHATDPLLDACGRLADRLHDWHGMPPTTIRFRSRHDAERHNLAISSDTLDVEGIPEQLDASRDGITALLAAGATVPDAWLDNLEP